MDMSISHNHDPSVLSRASKENEITAARTSTGKRLAAAVFELGFHKETILSSSHTNQLPTCKEVLLYLYYRKRLPKFYRQPVRSVIVCPYLAGTHIVKC